MTNKVLLRVTDLTKSYAGVQALRCVLRAARGEVHALIGENGAGKSTLIKIITGAIQADSGEIKLNEQLSAPFVARGAGDRDLTSSRRCFPN